MKYVILDLHLDFMLYLHRVYDLKVAQQVFLFNQYLVLIERK